MKSFFYDDYSDGAHNDVLKQLIDHNEEPQLGYGKDEYTEKAARRIAEVVGGNPSIYFISGGTQANLTILSHMLKSHEAVIASDCAHINNHEAGALEATGHKLVSVPTKAGKMNPQDVERIISQHDEYMVKPRVLEITQATEQGTIYSKAELKALIDVAKKHGMLVYLDGARLAHALTAQKADLTITDLPKLGVDAFYIGGTKNGALCGEAVVIVNPEIATDFTYSIRQHGGILAKGRLIGLQFMGLFENDLWLNLAKHANDMAAALSEGAVDSGLELTYPTDINQVFVTLTPAQVERLNVKYGFHVIEKIDDRRHVARLVCSWATTENQIRELIADMGSL
jgi:threonine aldolase